MADQIQMDYNEVFSTDAGQRVLDDLMEACHVLEPTDDYRHEVLAAREGRRDVVFHILARLGYKSANFPSIVEGTKANET